MGITARGAWESIKRHFRELNIDVMKTDITVVGIGDMSGDVFGNGMLYNKHIKLVAAFDHRHIFIDPHPDTTISYHERLRLFNLPTSSWADYNARLISNGGGVFNRSAKSIPITAEMKEVLAIEESSLAPIDLIRAILTAPVDLLYNGGIGTYVKASIETNADVGDRTNDYARVNGNELRCSVVAEGGNLGFTQLGRIEYALNNGLINTDFIDNSAGVDCSDHEVNLKILLDVEINKKRLTEKKRNSILADVTQEVAALVLKDNYDQALVMSFSTHHAKKNIGLHIEYIKQLETSGLLKRKVEFIPDDKSLAERKTAGFGLTRPELAVLLAYSKINIQNELAQAQDLLSDPTLKQIVVTAFPPTIRKKYARAMDEHRLAKEIIATQLSNKVINEMGITFVYRIQAETGAPVEEIIRAYTLASSIFETPQLQQLVVSLDFKVDSNEQYAMLYNIRHLINLATRWFLHSRYLKQHLQSVIDHFRPRVKTLEPLIPSLMGGATKDYLHALTQQFTKDGLPKEAAQRIATFRAIYTALNIIEVATSYKLDLEKTARIYFAAGEKINLLWFRDYLATDSREGHWNVLARLTLRLAVLKNDKKGADEEKLINLWVKKHARALSRWDRLLTLMHSSNHYDYSMFFIAMRELIALIQLTQHEPIK
jgi:glutamate dehydrogenase